MPPFIGSPQQLRRRTACVIESFADVAREVSMKSTATHRRRCSLAVVLALVLSNPVFAQICKPVSQRTGELGCWIVAHESMGQLTQPQVFWHLDVYPTHASAEAAKGPHGTVVESLEKVWLLSIEDAGWRASVASGSPKSVHFRSK